MRQFQKLNSATAIYELSVRLSISTHLYSLWLVPVNRPIPYVTARPRPLAQYALAQAKSVIITRSVEIVELCDYVRA